MYFDNLTIAGILMLVPYALLPFFFGRELIRVREDSATVASPPGDVSQDMRFAPQTADCPSPGPCR